MQEKIKELSGLSEVVKVDTYRAFVPGTGIEVEIYIKDSGIAGDPYRYVVSGKALDADALRAEGVDVPESLFNNNGGATIEEALATTHWSWVQANKQ